MIQQKSCFLPPSRHFGGSLCCFFSTNDDNQIYLCEKKGEEDEEGRKLEVSVEIDHCLATFCGPHRRPSGGEWAKKRNGLILRLLLLLLSLPLLLLHCLLRCNLQHTHREPNRFGFFGLSLSLKRRHKIDSCDVMLNFDLMKKCVDLKLSR